MNEYTASTTLLDDDPVAGENWFAVSDVDLPPPGDHGRGLPARFTGQLHQAPLCLPDQTARKPELWLLAEGGTAFLGQCGEGEFPWHYIIARSLYIWGIVCKGIILYNPKPEIYQLPLWGVPPHSDGNSPYSCPWTHYIGPVKGLPPGSPWTCRSIV